MSRLRRALLFMPADDLHKIEKGAALSVDSIIMDLEDGVAHNQKTEARQTIKQAFKTLEFGTTEKLIRINPINSGLEPEDLAATIALQPDGYVIPKLETAQQIIWMDNWLRAEEEKHGFPVESIRLLAIIESALGIVHLKEIASSVTRLEALLFGAEDLAGDLGAIRRSSAEEINYGRSALLIHAKAFGLQAIDTPYVELHNLEGLAEETQRAMQMGYDGKLAIHPKHIPIIEQGFAPSQSEIEQAQALIAAHEEHQKNGSGVFAHQGKMVDMPMIRAAKKILLRADSVS